jgi:predicted Rossmann fold nucleotide-binding protein DprA/Smf involved in DNA uptake
MLTCADDLVEVPINGTQGQLRQDSLVEGLEGGTPRHLDELAVVWNCTASDALQRVLDLELDGRITRLPGNLFLARVP